MHLGIIDGRMQQLGRVGPPSVEVDSKDVASVIPIDDTIWIKHRHNLKNEKFSQGLSLLTIWLH